MITQKVPMSDSSTTVIITEFMDAAAVRRLQDQCTVHYDPDLVDDRSALLARLPGAQAIIVRNRTQVDGALLAAAPQLRVVGRLGVGLDNIDVAACRDRDVTVIPATGANAAAVAEYVIAAALMLLRGAYGATSAVAQGGWPRPALSQGREAAGKTLGLAGFGDIGRRVARLAQALGMAVVAHDPGMPATDPAWAAAGVGSVGFDALLAQSDVLSLHMPLTPATRGLLGEAALARMKPGSVLINTARGGIVDEAALVAALRSGHLAGAALDVFAQEPLPASPGMAAVPGLLLTPHIAGLSQESNTRVSDMIAQRVLDALNQGATRA